MSGEGEKHDAKRQRTEEGKGSPAAAVGGTEICLRGGLGEDTGRARRGVLAIGRRDCLLRGFTRGGVAARASAE